MTTVFSMFDRTKCVKKSISDTGIEVIDFSEDGVDMATKFPDVIFAFAFPGIPEKGIERIVDFLRPLSASKHFICAPDAEAFRRMARLDFKPRLVRANWYNYESVRNRPLVIGTNFAELKLNNRVPSDIYPTPFGCRFRIPYALVREIMEQCFGEIGYNG